MDSSFRDAQEASVETLNKLQHADARALVLVHNEVYPAEPWTPERIRDRLRRLRACGGRAWIVRHEGAIAGYGATAPTPGLDGLYEVDGFIAPALRRRGLATSLLRAMTGDLASGGACQIYHPLASTDSPAGRFLQAQGFYTEHEETCLSHDDPGSLPPAEFGDSYELRSLSRAQAINWFRRLYRASFEGHPWYQPYESDDEVDADLVDADDLLFLAHQQTFIGFLWLRWPEMTVAEIEPIGLSPAYQRRGLGRQLMLAAMERATQAGGRSVRIGTWSRNETAIRLYQRLGFKETGRRLFLAYDLIP